jgi:acetyltransferase-like isoleucine patch superfamily enzyme
MKQSKEIMKSDEMKSPNFLEDLKYCGKEVKIFEKAQLIKPEMISVGDYSQIDDFAWILSGQGVKIGRRVHISAFSSIAGGGKCSIEDYASVAIGCRIITGSDDFSGEFLINPCVPSEYRNVTRSFVRICRFATLATNVIVTPGVTIGEGALVLSGSMVTADLPEWGIYIGAPPRPIGKRDAKVIRGMAQDLEGKYG